jgi:hypothetical protein
MEYTGKGERGRHDDNYMEEWGALILQSKAQYRKIDDNGGIGRMMMNKAIQQNRTIRFGRLMIVAE